MFHPAPNVVQLAVEFNSMGNICENILHYSSGAAPDAGTMNNLIDAYIELENSQLKALRTGGTFLTRVVARDLGAQDGTIVDRQVIPTIIGTAAGPSAPGNVTVACAVRTGLGGRSFRGRIYHVGMGNPQFLNNALTVAAQNNFATTYSLLLTLGVAPIFHLGVLSRRHLKADRDPALFTPATAITVDINLDSQRRRLNGRGT